MDFQSIIDHAVELREEKRFIDADGLLTSVVTQASAENKWNFVVKALQHRAIIFQRKFDELEGTPGAETNLKQLGNDAAHIIKFTHQYNLSDADTAVGFLRYGDYHFRSHEYDSARRDYEHALTFLPETHNGRYVEFTQKLRLAQVYNGDRRAWYEFPTLLEIIDTTKDYTADVLLGDDHRLIIRSGLLISDAMAGHKLGVSPDVVSNKLHYARLDAMALASHGKKLRLEEVERFERKFGVTT
jgi:tetratricopeptide (TPR) repeat protein